MKEERKKRKLENDKRYKSKNRERVNANNRASYKKRSRANKNVNEKRHYIKCREKILERKKEYSSLEKIKKLRNVRQQIGVKKMTDGYIKSLIARKNSSKKNIPKELIEVKRLHLQLKRKLGRENLN